MPIRVSARRGRTEQVQIVATTENTLRVGIDALAGKDRPPPSHVHRFEHQLMLPVKHQLERPAELLGSSTEIAAEDSSPAIVEANLLKTGVRGSLNSATNSLPAARAIEIRASPGQLRPCQPRPVYSSLARRGPRLPLRSSGVHRGGQIGMTAGVHVPGATPRCRGDVSWRPDTGEAGCRHDIEIISRQQILLEIVGDQLVAIVNPKRHIKKPPQVGRIAGELVVLQEHAAR